MLASARDRALSGGIAIAICARLECLCLMVLSVEVFRLLVRDRDESFAQIATVIFRLGSKALGQTQVGTKIGAGIGGGIQPIFAGAAIAVVVDLHRAVFIDQGGYPRQRRSVRALTHAGAAHMCSICIDAIVIVVRVAVAVSIAGR